jgi:hypothetical protein
VSTLRKTITRLIVAGLVFPCLPHNNAQSAGSKLLGCQLRYRTCTLSCSMTMSGTSHPFKSINSMKARRKSNVTFAVTSPSSGATDRDVAPGGGGDSELASCGRQGPGSRLGHTDRAWGIRRFQAGRDLNGHPPVKALVSGLVKRHYQFCDPPLLPKGPKVALLECRCWTW